LAAIADEMGILTEGDPGLPQDWGSS
jgi:hypothetical protein